jgi:hypothetical protein
LGSQSISKGIPLYYNQREKYRIPPSF